MPHTLHLVSHTHWDREWYLTFQQFRMKLVDLIDHLLDLLDRDPDFRSFHLDAQTVVLEDYLEIKPHNRQRIEQYVRNGRIIVGPWYQLNDEFLTSGEATIRSLLVGMRIARQFGACAQIGYLPDQFGNISQMPQIFHGFGIDNAVFGRGYQLVDDRKMEFYWQSPDGSRVLASLMAFWYNNAQHIPAEPGEARRYLTDLRERMAPYSVGSHLLLMNGVDHLEAQVDLSANLAAVRPELQDGDRILHSTIQEYLDALKQELAAQNVQLETHSGELREDRNGSCLAGTLSARMYLKQANHRAQLILEKYAEPFSAFAMQAGFGYPQDFFQYAWKLLMHNHPHDSICGCSIDQVHCEMMPRFAQVEQIGNELADRAQRRIADRITIPGSPIGLVVFNSLNWVRTDPVRATLVFPLGPATRGNPPRDDTRAVSGITLTDGQGVPVLFAVIGNATKVRQVLSPVELPLDQWVQEISIEFIAQNIPACGYKVFSVTICAAMPEYAAWGEAEDQSWQPVLQDGGDVGDEYLYRSPVNDQHLEIPALGALITEESNAVQHSALYSSTIELPGSAAGDLTARSVERVVCTGTTRVTHWVGCPRVEYLTTIDNRAKDHRLRVVFQDPAGRFQPLPYSIAEGQFDVLARPLRNPLAREGAAPFYPQQNWVALVGQTGSQNQMSTVTVINQGLPEYEIDLNGAAPRIGVTLLRCVGSLSRRDDGPGIETPEAQCQGEHTFRYAFLETEGNWKEGMVWKQAYQFNVPLTVMQTDEWALVGKRDLPPELSFITVEPEQLVVTAVKRAEDDLETLIVRFFNPTDEFIAGGRIWVRNATSAQLMNLNEEVQSRLEINADGCVNLSPIRPKEIVTLGFHLPSG